MNLLLVDVSQWVLFGILIVIIVLAPVLMGARNKKEMAKAQQVMDSLKKGDKVLTSAGVIGKIVGIADKDGYKTVTIETGDEKHKGYMTVDIAAIYMNLSAPVEQPAPKTEEKTANASNEQTVEAPAEEKVEEKAEETQEEQPKEQTAEVAEQEKTEEKPKSKKKKSK